MRWTHGIAFTATAIACWFSSCVGISAIPRNPSPHFRIQLIHDAVVRDVCAQTPCATSKSASGTRSRSLWSAEDKTRNWSRVMKPKQSLPIPFVILILAAVVSMYSLVAGRASGAPVVQDNSLQMQTVEQERVAAIYFRILSWLSDVTHRNAEPVQAKPQPAAAPQAAKGPRRSECKASVALCAFRYAHDLALGKSHARSLN